jgi:hypothetical protein
MDIGYMVRMKNKNSTTEEVAADDVDINIPGFVLDELVPNDGAYFIPDKIEIEPASLCFTSSIVQPGRCSASTFRSSELSDTTQQYLRMLVELQQPHPKNRPTHVRHCAASSDIFDPLVRLADVLSGESVESVGHIRIRAFSEQYSSTRLVELLERSCETSCIPWYGPKRRVYLTDKNDYTHAIIFDYAMPNVQHIPKENVIGMAHCSVVPSSTFIRYAQSYIRVYFSSICVDRHGSKLPPPFIRHVAHPFIELPTTYYMGGTFGRNTLLGHLKDPPYTKTRMMSISISATKNTPSHQYRRALVSSIMALDLPIDIFGTGCINHNQLKKEKDSRIRGPYADISAMLDPYLFHICIETMGSHSYYSGKAVNALLRKTNPVYFGSTALVEQFPGIISLTGILQTDLDRIRDIVSDPLRYYMPIYSDQIRTIKRAENLVRHLPRYFAGNYDGASPPGT